MTNRLAGRPDENRLLQNSLDSLEHPTERLPNVLLFANVLDVTLFQRIEDKFSKATKFLAVTHRPPSTRWIRWTALCGKLEFIAQDDRIHWRLTGRFQGSSTSSDRSNGGPCFYRVCKWLANGKDELIETQCPIRHHLRSQWNLQDKENRICLRFHSSLISISFQSHSSLIPVSFGIGPGTGSFKVL